MRLQARDTKGPSMEQNCERAKRAACGIGRPGSCLFFHLYNWVIWGCVPTLSVPRCLLICQMGLLMRAMR